MSSTITNGRRRSRHYSILLSSSALVVLCLAALLVLVRLSGFLHRGRTSRVPFYTDDTIAKCHSLHIKPGPPPSFGERTTSDRFELGTKPFLIRNATLWTGNNQGREVIKGDLLLDGAIVKAVGRVEPSMLAAFENVTILDVGVSSIGMIVH